MTESTVNSAPKKVNIIEKIIAGNPIINGLLKIILVKPSFVSSSFSLFDNDLLNDL